ncbi:MAG: MFS transporter [Anaerolineae bacterium]|nr:MFS transporter [Anaerolineae bacterium]MCZ7553585.1 MFS transporter [Anaerolineales bacterium]
MLARIDKIYREFPAKFWVVVAAAFVDRVGGNMLFPFFTLYVTQKFGIGMTQAGALLGVYSIFGFLGNMLGGALTDRFGRKRILLFGLVFSALSAVSLGLANRLWVMYLLSVAVGLLSDIAGPAWQAMIADLLPEKQRTEGFGVLRVTANLSWIVGPVLAGLLASRSFMLLFGADAVTSLLTALIILRAIPETKPQPAAGEQPAEPPEETLLDSLGGYRKVFQDRLFIAYIAASVLMTVVYVQMYSTLSVYLRDNHGVAPQQFGFLLTSSAITVVLLQFWVTRRIKNYAPMLMMALGAFFYMIGFGMFGFVSAYALFVLAIVLITLGEMIVMPVSQALAANFAPEDMRGRYMAVFGLVWGVPGIIGPVAAGLVMDNFNPNWVWYLGGLLCAAAAVGFLLLQRAAGRRFPPEPEPAD